MEGGKEEKKECPGRGVVQEVRCKFGGGGRDRTF